MGNSTEWTTFYDAFFAAHPEWLGDARYRYIKGSDRPEMVLSLAGARAFVQWVQAHPFLRYDPQGLAGQLAKLDALDALQGARRGPKR